MDAGKAAGVDRLDTRTLCRLSSMETDSPRISAQTLRVLAALLSATSPELSGAEVGRASKLPSGTLYPILIRLEGAGLKVVGRQRTREYWVAHADAFTA